MATNRHRPRGTIRNSLHCRNAGQPGRPDALSENQVRKLKGYLQKLLKTKKGSFPMSNTQLGETIRRYLNGKRIKVPRFKNNKPGLRWVKKHLGNEPGLLKTRPYERATRQFRNNVKQDIQKGKSQRSVSNERNRSRGTIQNSQHNRNTGKPGRPDVLSEKQVRELKVYLDTLLKNDQGSFPMSNTQLGEIIKKYLVKKRIKVSRFKNNKPDFTENTKTVFIDDYPLTWR
ncbi:hypothetical protein SNE40_022763 [Patella caerulea]|uniref:Uncharacterized protein n=1 Tax=Patella caerulea TaxID=87958 RepID=A0AAN8GGH4_PATCE